MYKPLPHNVTIKNSQIHGLGLFATCFIPKNTNIGLTHVYNDEFEDNYIRTPLGGFFNHDSKNPNCKILKKEHFIFLISIRDIKEGEELTSCYTFYNPELV